MKGFAVRQDYGALDEVFELANVPRPIRLGELFQCGGWNRFDRFLHLPGESLNEITHQQRDVFSALTQGRYVNRENVQPVVEIAPKLARLNHCFQVAVRGSDEPQVHFASLRAAQALELPLLERVQ